MTPQLTSIPQMLIKARGNMSEVSRLFGVTRHTVKRYSRDFDCKAHIVVNGVLMVIAVIARRDCSEETQIPLGAIRKPRHL